MISSIFSFEIINVIKHDPKISFYICASIAAAAVVNPNGIKTLLANGFSTFFIQGKAVFSNGPRSLPKNPPNCPILGN